MEAQSQSKTSKKPKKPKKPIKWVQHFYLDGAPEELAFGGYKAEVQGQTHGKDTTWTIRVFRKHEFSSDWIICYRGVSTKMIAKRIAENILKKRNPLSIKTKVGKVKFKNHYDKRPKKAHQMELGIENNITG